MRRALALLAVGLGLAGCGLGAGEEQPGGVELRVTRDFGQRSIATTRRDGVRSGDTVMRLLQSSQKDVDDPLRRALRAVDRRPQRRRARGPARLVLLRQRDRVGRGGGGVRPARRRPDSVGLPQLAGGDEHPGDRGGVPGADDPGRQGQEVPGAGGVRGRAGRRVQGGQEPAARGGRQGQLLRAGRRRHAQRAAGDRGPVARADPGAGGHGAEGQARRERRVRPLLGRPAGAARPSAGRSLRPPRPAPAWWPR